MAAATLQVLILTGFGLWNWSSDAEPFIRVWKQPPMAYWAFYKVLLAATLAWSIVPRVLIKLSPAENQASSEAIGR